MIIVYLCHISGEHLFWTDNLLVKSIILVCVISESPCRPIQETAVKSSWLRFESTSWLSKWFGWSGEREKQEWDNYSSRHWCHHRWVKPLILVSLPMWQMDNIQILTSILFGIYNSVKVTAWLVNLIGI